MGAGGALKSARALDLMDENDRRGFFSPPGFMEVISVRHKLVLLIAIPLVLAACNSITGTQTENAPTLNVPIKNCIDDFRAVNILQPCSDVYAGTRQLVVWEVEEFCSDYVATVEVSFDNGIHWASCSCTENGCMSLWCVGEDCAGREAWVKVTVSDVIGEESDMHRFPILPKPNRIPQHRD